MTTLILLEVGQQDKPQKVEAQAISNNTANIYITANTMQEATELLQQGVEKAQEAVKNWKPVEKPVEEKPQKHYRVGHKAIEDIQAELDEYTSTQAGAKLVNALETAKEFCYKKSNGGMTYSEMTYFYNLTAVCKEWDAIGGAYHLAYRRGYNKAKNEQRRKAGSKC